MPTDQAVPPPRYRPHIQLVPLPLWGANMRALVGKYQWTKLRKALVERQGLYCAMCGKPEPELQKLNAHEEWQYDEQPAPATATLVNVSLVCWHCHHVEHWGRTKTLVADGVLTDRAIHDTIDHFCRLNGVSREDFSLHEKEATDIWKRRSQLNWRIDYGPFLGWVAAKFPRDPLNDAEWPNDVGEYWRDRSPPTMAEIVAALPPIEIPTPR